jgi:uncharacterized protein YqeY
MNSARRARDSGSTLVLGTLLAEAKNREIELRRELTDDDVIEVIRRAIKRRKESMEMFAKGNRPDLEERERAEAVVLEKYLPSAPSADEIRAAVRQAIGAGAANLGAAMSAVMPAFRGRADGSVINAIVREELARRS